MPIALERKLKKEENKHKDWNKERKNAYILVRFKELLIGEKVKNK